MQQNIENRNFFMNFGFNLMCVSNFKAQLKNIKSDTQWNEANCLLDTAKCFKIIT